MAGPGAREPHPPGCPGCSGVGGLPDSSLLQAPPPLPCLRSVRAGLVNVAG